MNEFINYIQEHEKNLKLQFSNLDKNKDGMKSRKFEIFSIFANFILFLGSVDLDEMIGAFKELGIQMDRVEAVRLFNR